MRRLLLLLPLTAACGTTYEATFTWPDTELTGEALRRGHTLTIAAADETRSIELVVDDPTTEQPWTQGEGAADRIEFSYAFEEQSYTEADVIGFLWSTDDGQWSGEVFWPGDRVAVVVAP